MPIPAPHIHNVVTAYLSRYPNEQELLQPLLDRLAAGRDVTDRTDFGGHVTTSGVVVNDRDEVLLIHHSLGAAHPAWRSRRGDRPHPARRRTTGDRRGDRHHRTGAALRRRAGPDRRPLDEARPDRDEPAHHHVDVRYIFRTRGTSTVTLQVEEVAGAEWCGPSHLGDPVLRARVLDVLGRPREDRPAEEDPYGTLVVITNEADEVFMHLRDDKEGIWAPGTWAPLGGGAEPADADPHATASANSRRKWA